MADPIGSVPEVTAKFYTTTNGVRALTDPTVVTATIEDPAGTETNPTAVKQSTGIYLVTFTADAAGLWHYRIVGDAPAKGAVEGTLQISDSKVLDSDPAADYTYVVGTDIGVVRLLIDDRDFSSVNESTPLGERSAIFNDLEIQAFITQETVAEGVSNTYRAAAVALLAIAASRVLMVKRRELDGANIDFGDLRRDLRFQAQEYLRLGDEVPGGQDAPADGVAEVNRGEFSEREIIINSWLRQGI